MAKPRKPYGNPPGRLPATMIKVLAAELSDSGRLGRGKQLWSGDAVIDIVIGRGAVTAEVQGSRRDPYVVTIETEPGDGTPRKADLWLDCTCPDPESSGRFACKHAVATLFALSDEVALEPELLHRWRSGRARHPAAGAPLPTPPTPGSRHLHAVPDPPPQAEPDTTDPLVEQIAGLLGAPGGAAAPAFAPVAPLEHPLPNGRRWATVLADALTNLQIDWD